MPCSSCSPNPTQPNLTYPNHARCSAPIASLFYQPVFRLQLQTSTDNNTPASNNNNDKSTSSIEIRKRHAVWSQGTASKDMFGKVCDSACISCRYADILVVSKRGQPQRVQSPGFQPVMMCNSKQVKARWNHCVVQGRERIVGGNLTADGEIPWQCSLLRGNDRSSASY